MSATELPLVTVIALCFNHQKYVKASLNSVWKQDYPNIQLLIVDDASTDGSVEEIENLLLDRPYVAFIQHKTNVGNCKSFNEALKLAQGKYIIDLATDDVLLPTRVSKQVFAFEQSNIPYGVCFSNASCIDADGKFLRNHYPIEQTTGKAKIDVPTGWVFKTLVEKHFLCPPTLMFKTDVLQEMGGYDETLEYEDFDIWLKISRKYPFIYIDEITTLRRELDNSLGRQFYIKNNRLTAATCTILERLESQLRDAEDKRSFFIRVWYEMKVAIWTDNHDVVNRYLQLLRGAQAPKMPFSTSCWVMAWRLGLPLNPLFALYKGRR